MRMNRAFFSVSARLGISFLIAASAYSISSRAENVYKCGASYSATPCPGGSLLELNDKRDPAQRQQTQEAARQDAQQANVLEKERLAQEKAAMKPAPHSMRSPNAKPSGKSASVITQITPKRLKKPGKKPDAFIAEIPGTEKKTAVKKVIKKKKPAPI